MVPDRNQTRRLLDVLSPKNTVEFFRDFVDERPDLQEEGAGEGAQPQILKIGGVKKEVWPEEWGITARQIAEFLEECRQDASWCEEFTIGQVVSEYVKPKTQGTGIGYALLVNASEPKEVVSMVSHAWQENAIDFCQTLARSVDLDEPLFICAFSLYQCEDGIGPSISQQLGSHPEENPFRRVLNHIQEKGKRTEADSGCWRRRTTLAWLPWSLAMLSLTCYFAPILSQGCIPMHGFCALGSCEPLMTWLPIYVWTWKFSPLQGAMLACVRTGQVMGACSLASWLIIKCLERRGTIYKGRMVAVPNHNEEMYSRLWCVFEMFVAHAFGVPVKLANTLAPVGIANSRNAKCSKVEDKRRIDSEIEAYGLERYDDKDKGYQVVDRAIRRVDRKAWVKAVTTEALWGWPIGLSLMCTVRLLKKGMVHFWKRRAATGRIHEDVLEQLKMLISHGRLGYDLFCDDVFAASEAKVWVWGLVLGVLLGQSFVVGRVVYIAKSEQGRTTTRMWLMTAALFLFCEAMINAVLLLLKAMGWCELRLYYFNWFILGLTAALSQGSAVLILVVLVSCCRCRYRRHSHILPHAQSRTRRTLMAFGLLLLLAMMIMTCQLTLWDHYLPTLVFNISLIFGGFLGPLAMAWTSALRWGVKIQPEYDDDWVACRQDDSEDDSDSSRSSHERGWSR
eukprot:TRINITY_DN43936_c0_g1_i1.p1 TRINITY_DN43936_c0_g1~~TRINITY_DN43936_c0_g1_i1.p1  ORF type:complete len:678 (-),score=77.11 TRINITY_DN43936_c0_g1_i1:26-2059(-)